MYLGLHCCKSDLNQTQPQIQDKDAADSLIGFFHRRRSQALRSHMPHAKLTVCIPPCSPGAP